MLDFSYLEWQEWVVLLVLGVLLVLWRLARR